MTAHINPEELFKQSYRRGLVIFGYGLLWLVASLAGYLLTDWLFGAGSGLGPALLTVTWGALWAGALGGTTAMLQRLQRHVAIEQNFLEQSLFSYLRQPLLGLGLGLLTLYLIAIPGGSIVNYAINPQVNLAELYTAVTFVALTFVLSWLAGFYQQQGWVQAKATLRRFTAAGSAESQALVPVEQVLHPAEDNPFWFRERSDYRKQLRSWTFTWGLFILGYGLFWLILLAASYVGLEPLWALLGQDSHVATQLFLVAWPVGLAGALGGVVNLLHTLYRHISQKQDFHRQHLMSYLVQPLVGLVFGLIIYFILGSGYLSLVSLVNEADPSRVLDAPTLLMAQLLLGWLAGFRNQMVTDLVLQMVQYVVSLFKLIGRLLYPPNLFDKEKRAEILAEISQQTGLFKPVRPEEDEEEFSYWATR